MINWMEKTKVEDIDFSLREDIDVYIANASVTHSKVASNCGKSFAV